MLISILLATTIPISLCGMESDLSATYEPALWQEEDIAAIRDELARRNAEVPPRDQVFARRYIQQDPPRLARYQLGGLAIIGTSVVLVGYYLFNVAMHLRSFHKV